MLSDTDKTDLMRCAKLLRLQRSLKIVGMQGAFLANDVVEIEEIKKRLGMNEHQILNLVDRNFIEDDCCS